VSYSGYAFQMLVPTSRVRNKVNEPGAYSHYLPVDEAKVVITTYSGYALQMLVPTSDIRTKIGDFKSK
jgi:hypothetical protein